MNKNGYIFIFLCVGVFIVGLSGCLFDKAVEDIAHQEVLKQYGSIAVNLKFDHKKIALKAPDGVETIRLVVSGLDMVPMTSEFSASLEEGVVDEIPVGNTRMIIATGLDSSGLILYQSISYADVTPNTQSIVDIDLLSISSLTIPPEVVSVTANFPDGFFKAESIIDIIIEFSQVVDVTGIPQLDLADSIGKIDYVSGTGTKELIFQYTVGAGQNCTDLDYVGSGSLTLNGGTIQNGGEVNALLTLSEPGTAGSLGDAVNIVIDTIAPFLNVDDIIVNNTVLPNTITVIFSEKIDSAAAEVVGNWLLESNGGD
ncbi:hypothetical protein KAJ27_14535, partial [bacterium]|nr:hypothetical protein [bacterium]